MLAKKIWFDSEFIYVETTENKIGKMPLDLFPKLKNPNQIDQMDFELWSDGNWIHWEKVGKDLSVDGFFTFHKNMKLAK